MLFFQLFVTSDKLFKLYTSCLLYPEGAISFPDRGHRRPPNHG